ncbi:acyl-CoA carboxylase subunit epsilon [Arthrobacter mobilis]|uniref:Acyl-CoA carboxylase subunit epsilon n=1 Tax=Arthrobacter mobilis TaxID=2724944 RepID=A0A7X6K537_9MICC|nr:acyl-CoA carboxylase subunit epsilon [Arthrobacter mobilis]NKX53375.1 acyl-CoA carboxylase subunit epsilon [Arthrobacter mobilis]
MTTNREDQETPLLTVAKGNPAPDELAALTAVILALQSAGGAGADSGTQVPGRRPRPRRRELLRPVVPFGPGAWRHSYR